MVVWMLAACAGGVTAGPGAWEEPWSGAPGVQAGPPGALSLWVEPLRPGAPGTFRVTGAAPGQRVVVLGSRAGEGAGPCVGGVCADVLSPVVIGRVNADAAGVATLSVNVPGNLAGDVWVQAVALGPDAESAVVGTDFATLTRDHRALTVGVGTVDLNGGAPSRLALWNDRAFPVLEDGDGRVIAAAARVNAGKVFVFGHETVTSGGAFLAGGGAEALVRNAIGWMAPGAPGGGVVVGVEGALGALANRLTARGYTVVTAGPSQLSGVDVWFPDQYADRNPVDDQRIRAFISSGGGVITGGHAWYWGYGNDEAGLNYPANQWLEASGVLVSEDDVDSGAFVVPTAPYDAVAGGSGALDALLDVAQGGALPFPRQVEAGQEVAFTTRVVPLRWAGWFDRVDQLVAGFPVVPTGADPVETALEPIDQVVVSARARYAEGLPPAALTADVAAADFPGAVDPAAPRVSVTRRVSATYAGRDRRYLYSGAGEPVWRSLGVYAAPGELLTVTVPAGFHGQGLRAQIGSHTDTLWHTSAWARVPSIVRSYPIDAPTVQIASAFGGLVYLTVPPGTALGDLDVTVDGGVEAPFFELGVDTDLDWQTTLRARPAPWGELKGERFLLTLPSSVLATLNDPTALMTLWDEVLDAEALLAGIPVVRPREERAVVDRQISAGWMHSGYPFMAHLDSAQEFSDTAILGVDGSWGAFHELGHNHQWEAWELPGTTEGTVNLWSLYVMETVVGNPPGHPAMTPAERAARVADYVAGGRDFEGDWSVWTALETYVQLQEHYGWPWMQALIGSYVDDDPALDPADDQERMDTFALRAGELAGHDLGPFFTAWGWPLSPTVLSALATLPAGGPVGP